MIYTRLFGLFVLVTLSTASAQSTRPADSGTPADRLDQRFVSRAAGISFCPPTGGIQNRRLGIGTEIVTFASPAQRWTLKVSQLWLDKPTRLLGIDDPRTPIDESQTQPGLLDQTLLTLRNQNISTQLLRKDTINVGANDVGLLITRYTQAAQPWLRQQAFIQRNDQHFYVLDLITPSGRTAATNPDDEDAAERLAVETFTAVLDTIHLLDQRPIREDNEQRLYRTRTLMVNIPKRIPQAIKAEQHFRLLRAGKDVGWSFIAEELAERHGTPGFYVASLTTLRNEENIETTSAAEMFCATDLFKKADEAWMAINVARKDGKNEHSTEVGQSTKRIKRVLDEQASAGPSNDRQPAIRQTEIYTLEVTQTDRSGSKKFTKDLPPYYLPQAMGSMLPRLVPLSDAKGYLFLSWVGIEQEPILRYIDVEPLAEVQFNGRKIHAIRVKDRIGLEGNATFHYLTADGKYLGWTNAAANLTAVTCDAETLKQLYPDAVIGRPRLLDNPQPAQ